MQQLTLFHYEPPAKPVNVATVPMRSPFRYPGGKTWFVPYIRKWLKTFGEDIELIEPFAGGGIVSLTAGFENLAKKIIMVEKDEDIAAFLLQLCEITEEQYQLTLVRPVDSHPIAHQAFPVALL